jgi:hypothetical protein
MENLKEMPFIRSPYHYIIALKNRSAASGLQLPRHRKLPRTLLWLATSIAVSIVCAGLYFVYSSVTNTLPGGSGLDAGATPPVIPTQNDLGHSYGIAAGGSLGDLNAEQLDARMAGIAASGAKWVRFDFNWANIQPDNAKTYNWGVYDKLVLAAQKHKLYILGILDYTPVWARSSACTDSDKCRPANNDQFAQFARTVSNRYKNRGLHYWEIWNEPNNPQFWQPAANPTDYTRLLQATAKALRAEDKEAYIITAGLSPQETEGPAYAPIDFLAGVYKAGGKSSFDAVAHHPYTFPISPKSSPYHAWTQMSDDKAGMRGLMIKNGDGKKKIWITEIGAPTGGPGAVSTIENPRLEEHPFVVDERLQAKLLSDAIDLYKSYDWVGPFMYYSYKDAGTTQDTNENFFGLVRADDSKKPAYQTFQEAATGAKISAP